MKFVSKKFLGLLVLVLIISGLAYSRLKPLDKTGSTSSPGEVSALPVSIKIVKPERVHDRLLATGTVLANEEVELKPEIGGRVTAVSFAEGSDVKAGQTLVTINDAELKAQVRKAEFQRKLAKEKEDRGRRQLDIDAISQQEYDILLSEFETREAEVDLVKAQLAKTRVRAPFDGRIGLRYVSVGSYVSPNTRIANLLDLDPVKIEFSIPEKYAGFVKEGNEITFKVQGVTNKFTGTVYAIEPQIDRVTRTVKLRARSSNRDGVLLPGAFAEVELILHEIDDALMVPTESLIPDLQGQKVYLLRGGKVASQLVETGLRTDKSVQVTSGVQAGDSVLTTGILQVRPGVPVTVSDVE